MKEITVKQLIEELQKFDDSVVVMIGYEGVACNVRSIEDQGDYVILCEEEQP